MEPVEWIYGLGTVECPGCYIPQEFIQCDDGLAIANHSYPGNQYIRCPGSRMSVKMWSENVSQEVLNKVLGIA